MFYHRNRFINLYFCKILCKDKRMSSIIANYIRISKQRKKIITRIFKLFIFHEIYRVILESVIEL